MLNDSSSRIWMRKSHTIVTRRVCIHYKLNQTETPGTTVSADVCIAVGLGQFTPILVRGIDELRLIPKEHL